MVSVRQHRILRRSAKLAYLGYAALGRLPQPAALPDAYLARHYYDR